LPQTNLQAKDVLNATFLTACATTEKKIATKGLKIRSIIKCQFHQLAVFMSTDPKSAKNTVKLSVFFCAFGICALVKSAPSLFTLRIRVCEEGRDPTVITLNDT